MHVIYTDIRFRIIENYTVFLAFILVFITAYELNIQINFFISLISLIIGFLLFSLNLIGAGDVKFFSVLMLIIPKEYEILFIFLMSFIGGILALIMIILRKKDRGVAYGVAISIAFLSVWIIGKVYES